MMLVFGEIFSFLAAICLAYSTFSKKKDKMIFWQIIDSLFNSISNVFLLSYSGCITNIFTLLRNYLTYKGKFNKKCLIIIMMLLIFLGICFNNKGFIGILPIIASIEYTIFMYKTKTVNKLRIGLIINLIMWGVYDFYIKSYPMFAMDMIIIVLSLINNYKYQKHIV